jgi:hypothetical protein
LSSRNTCARSTSTPNVCSVSNRNSKNRSNHSDCARWLTLSRPCAACSAPWP